MILIRVSGDLAQETTAVIFSYVRHFRIVGDVIDVGCLQTEVGHSCLFPFTGTNYRSVLLVGCLWCSEAVESVLFWFVCSWSSARLTFYTSAANASVVAKVCVCFFPMPANRLAAFVLWFFLGRLCHGRFEFFSASVIGQGKVSASHSVFTIQGSISSESKFEEICI